MAGKFKIGDVVMLKSGGPAMTIDGVGDGTDNEVSVIWFDNDEDLQHMDFDENVLELYDDEDMDDDDMDDDDDE